MIAPYSKGQYFGAAFLASGPLLSLFGNAPSDAWLGVVALLFLVHCTIHKDWRWLSPLWVKMFFAFWLWGICVTLLEDWSSSNLKHAITWVRFPLFAIAMGFWLSENILFKRFLMLMLAISLAIMAAATIFERIVDPNTLRLNGIWQGGLPKSGWFLANMGLIYGLFLMAHSRGLFAKLLIALSLFLIVFNTHEINMLAITILGLASFFVWTGYYSWCAQHTKKLPFAAISLLLVLGFGILGVGTFAYKTSNHDPNEQTESFPERSSERFKYGIERRLPWQPSSDYYTPWASALVISLENPLTGVGVDRYIMNCETMFAESNLGAIQQKWPEILVDDRNWCIAHHPHQLYLQFFAETGLIGVIFFAIGASHLIIRQLRLSLHQQHLLHAVSFTLLLVAFWPIATFSDAFGQHRNFFMWFMVAVALIYSQSLNKRYRSLFY